MTETTVPSVVGRNNDFVAVHATNIAELPLDHAVLIGITGMPGDMTALFRSSGGRIHVLKTGELSPLGPILEITQAGVVVERMNGFSKFLPPIQIGKGEA